MSFDAGAGLGRTTFSGLATGLDTAALISALLDFERRPLNLIQARRDDVSAQQSKFRELNTKLLALRDTARALDNRISTLSGNSLDEEFLAYRVESTDESIVRATATGDASAGVYDVTVKQLASVGRSISKEFASSETVLFAEGETLSIDFTDATKTDFTVAVPAGGYSLQNVRDAIQLHPDNDGSVTAEVLFDGTNYRLIISGTQTGSDGAFAVSGTGAGLGAADLVDPVLSQAAGDAIVSVLGVDVTRSSNTIEDALPGLTLELLAEHPADTDVDTLTVTLDQEGIEEKLQALVDAYNDVTGLIDAQFDVDEEGQGAGPLGNDPLLRSIQAQVQRLVGDRYLTGQGPGGFLTPFSTLSDIGVSFDRNARLSLDSDRLREALGRDPQAVRELLGGSVGLDDDQTAAVEGDGVASAIARRLEQLTRFGDGILAQQDQGLQSQLEGLDRQIERFEARLLVREETLLIQFSRLEAAISKLQSQSFFLGSVG